MWLEALKPLRLKRRAGDILLVPGTPFEFSEENARRLLAKVPDGVRVVQGPVQVGMIAEWTSPLFASPLRAVVLAVGQDTFTVHHPRTEQEATLPIAWLTRVSAT